MRYTVQDAIKQVKDKIRLVTGNFNNEQAKEFWEEIGGCAEAELEAIREDEEGVD